MTQPFVHPVTVRFSEVDSAGIVFFSRVFEYCHCAYEELLAHGDLPLARMFEQQGWGMPLVRAEADFRRPMRLGDALQVHMEIGELGKTSVRFDFRVVGSDGDLRATAQHRHVCVDLQSFTPMRVQPELLDAFERAGLALPQTGA